MKHALFGTLLMTLVAVSCGGGSGESPTGNTLPTVNNGDLTTAPCPEDDPGCGGEADGDAASPAPDAIVLDAAADSEGPLAVRVGGFFFSDGTVSKLCSSLAESSPPQCGDDFQEIDAPLDVALAYVAESFASPDDAKINIDQGIYWTDEWVNIAGFVKDGKLVLDG